MLNIKVLHGCDFDMEDIKHEYWYGRVDIQLFKYQVNKEASKMALWKGGKKDTDQFCKRGLESLSPEGSRRHYRTLSAARRAVLQKQTECRRNGDHQQMDLLEKCLAQVYQEFALPSQEEATARAEQYAREDK
jgi:hypothetical protein